MNKQNVEGTSNFLRLLRGATNGNANFQIVLSPIPNGEDELIAKRKEVAQNTFDQAWGGKVGLDLQIPYHPRLALSEELYTSWKAPLFLADAYRKIEQQVLKGVGVDVPTLLPDLIATIRREDYLPALQKLRQFARLDDAKSSLSKLVLKLFFPMPYSNMMEVKAGPSIAQMVSNPIGRELIGFLVEHISYEIEEIGTDLLIQQLVNSDFELADAAFQLFLANNPKEANMLGIYANFLITHRGDPEQAQAFYLRAIEADPKDANNLGNYGQFLLGNGQFQQAEEQLLAGITHIAPTKTSNLAELCFSLWLATRLQNKAATSWLQGFKFYLQQGFKRTPWNFTRMLAQAEKLLTPEDLSFAQALADAFLNADKLPAIDQFEQWRTLEAKPVK